MDWQESKQLLTELHHKLRQDVKARWNRSVSFQDELFDRWERASFLGFGEGTSIYQDSMVIGDVQVGQRTWIGPFVVLDGSGGLTIGTNCSISAGVQIYTHDTVMRRLSDGKITPERQPTSIGDSCYIGPYSVITKGVTIGHHAVVGAHSLVSKDVPPYTVVYGVPARKRGEVLVDETGVPRIQWSEERTQDLLAAIEALADRIASAEAELDALKRDR